MSQLLEAATKTVYDGANDVLYVKLVSGVIKYSRALESDNEIIIDFDQADRVVGARIIGASLIGHGDLVVLSVHVPDQLYQAIVLWLVSAEKPEP